MRMYEEHERHPRSRPGAIVLTICVVCSGVATWFGAKTDVFAAEPIVRKCETAERGHPRLFPPPASGPKQIVGFVRSPRLSTFDAGPDPRMFAFTFSGALNAKPDQWRIELDALRSANLNPNEGETGDVVNWQNVTSFDITGEGTGDEPNAFTFSQTEIRPFKDLPEEAWKPGGLGRLRVVATMNEDRSRCAFLPALDSDGLDPANAATIVVADGSVDPAKPLGQTDETIRNRFNEHTPDYLSANPRIPPWLLPTTPKAEPLQLLLQKLTTTAYYRSIGTNELGTGRPLAVRFPTLDLFIGHYFRDLEATCRDGRPASNEQEQMATYFNKGDLGIGREMHCIYRDCTAELACYVKNFAAEVNVCRQPSSCRNEPVFDYKEGAYGTLLEERPFATVAMVERGKMVGLPNNVFFVVYDANGKLNTDAAQLDNKGFNTSIPGNCLQCHGINSTFSVRSTGIPIPPFFRRQEVTNAMFLPFDLNAFEFFSEDKDDPDDPLSRASQESAFRAFNRMVLDRSTLGRSPAAREVIEGWYRGDLSDPTDRTFEEFFGPAGWFNAVDDRGVPDINARLHQQQLYREFIAIGCRTCHISSVVPGDLEARNILSFSREDHFLPFVRNGKVKNIVCGHVDPDTPASVAHEMPAAEQTLKVLWQKAGRQHLFAQVPGLFGDCAP